MEDGKEYLVDDLGLKHVFYTYDGIELTPQKALLVLNEQDIDYNRNVIQRGVVYPYSNEVILNSSSKIKCSRAKVTPDVRGPASISKGTSIQTSESFGGSINVSASIKSLIVAEVKAEVGFTWNTTSTSSSSFNATFNVPSNKIGAVYFTPYLQQFDMYYYNVSGQQYNIIAKSPIKLSSGFTDGLYELITSEVDII